MKKIICALLILLCAMSLFACTDSDNGKTGDNSVTVIDTQTDVKTDNVNLTDIKNRIIDECGIEGAMDIDTYMLLNLYGIEEADVADSACFTTMEGVFPDEIIMIKAKDSDASKRITEKLGNRLEAVLAQSKNYDAENYEIAQKCEVITKGDIVALFVSAKHEQMQEIFSSEF